MARLAKHHVHAALDRAAEHILAAGGPDGIVSRRDIRLHLGTLANEERELVDMLYRFIDYRDAKPGARVTKSDVDATLAFTKDDLVDDYDLDHNGLSHAEIAKMAKVAQLAASLARPLKRQAVRVSVDSGKELADQLGELSKGLIFDAFGTTATFKPFHREAKLTTLDKPSFAATLGLDLANPKQEIARHYTNLDDFFMQLVEIHQVIAPSLAPNAQNLVDLMRASLHDLAAFIVGRDGPGGPGAEHPIYIVGIAPDGDLVGLESVVVWT